jgi:AraC-like DNA-binding protein
LANILGIHLLRQHSSVKQPLRQRSVGLDQTTLRRVSIHIEEHLTDDLSLADLAAVAALSPYYFARLFKASTIVSPHQYVIQRRIERAKLLLSNTHWSLTAIASRSALRMRATWRCTSSISPASCQAPTGNCARSCCAGARLCAHLAVLPDSVKYRVKCARGSRRNDQDGGAESAVDLFRL